MQRKASLNVISSMTMNMDMQNRAFQLKKALELKHNTDNPEEQIIRNSNRALPAE